MPGFRSETALPERDTTVLDVFEQMANGHQCLVSRRGSWNVANFNPRIQIYNLNTGSWPIVGLTDGFYWYETTSAANSIRSRQFQDLQPGFPGDESLAPAAGRYPYRITYEMVIKRATPLVADAPLGFYISFVGLQIPEGTTNCGFGIYSSTPVNGGRWSVVSRKNTGGAAGATIDTGIAGDTQILARLIYEHTSNPRLWAEVNGTVFGLLQGVANMPVIPGGQDWFVIIVNGQSVGGGVGQVDRFRQPRIKIEELAGYDT